MSTNLPPENAASTCQPIIEARGLRKSFGALEVLRGVDLDVAPGEVVVVIGPSGCGKSTLLRCIVGTLKPGGGRVLAGSDDIAQLAPRARAQRIAMLWQSFASHDDETSVFEHVALGRTPYLPPYGALRKSDDEIIENALRAVNAEEFCDRSLSQLSGGERQRVSLARALAQQPQILLLDEPASNLDIRYAHEMLDLILKTARREKLAVVLVLHQLNLAAAVADQMLLLNGDGSVRACGAPQNAMTEENLRAVFGTPLSVFPHPRSGRPQARSDWDFFKEEG